jgi:peptide-methionine (S)-S-oxide reductase
VLRTRVGYCGGKRESPTYWDLGDQTEAVSIDFDPMVLSFDDLLDHFWDGHHFGNEIRSTQYRNAVFYRDESQKERGEESRVRTAEKAGVSLDRVKTPLLPCGVFTYAEGYHQNYYLTSQRALRAFLETTYPRVRSFADSAVATRLNGIMQLGAASSFLTIQELTEFGLPDTVETSVRTALGG